MSKVLVDDTILSRAIKAMWLGFDSLCRSGSVFANDLDLAIHGLEKAIEDSNSKRFSVIEWHPVSERIGKGYDILLRFDNGNIAPALSDDLDYAIERGAIEWAYLPKE